MKTILRKSGFLAVFLLMAMFFTSTAFGQASVTLDQADLDYAPGETVYITGTGWQPGETITLEIDNLTNPTVDCGAVEPEPHELWTTVADGQGNFTASWYVNDCELGADLLLEAFGITSGSTYEIFFTDALQTQIIDMSPENGTCGASLDVSARLQSKAGNNPYINVAGSILKFTLGTSIGYGTTNNLGIATTTLVVPNLATSLLVQYFKPIGDNTYQETSSSIAFSVSGAPSGAGSITGNSTVCPETTNISYSILPVANATTYNWTVPTGATITSGQGSITIVVSFGSTSGNVTVTPSNACGNGISSLLAVTVSDTTDPVLVGVPAAATASCDNIPAAAVVTATDNCDATPLVELDEVSTQVADLENIGHYNYAITRTWTAVDATGNDVSASQVITVSDTVDPVLVGVPAATTASCDNIPTAVVVTATDNCDATPSVTMDEVSTKGTDAEQASFYNYTITRTWTAVDATGNDVSAFQEITVSDTVDPVLVGVPAAATASCDNIPAAAVVTATDNCDATPLVELDEVSTQVADLENIGHYNYTITRTWTAVDATGNDVSASQVITVSDTTDPVLVGVPAAATASCDNIPAAAVVTATDNCDATPLVELDEVSTQVADLENIGHYNYTITRTWTATDAAGNDVSASQVITVSDTVDPVLVGVPAAATASCDNIPAAVVVTATDNCDATPLVELDEVSTQVADLENIGHYNYTITRTWTATDAAGNDVSASQVITVSDTTDPVLVGVPAAATASCDNIPAAAVVTATDNCDATPLVELDEVSTQVADLENIGHYNYAITRTWTAVDAAGNDVSASQVITVSDTVDPVLVGVPAAATASCDNIPTVAVVTATDNCDATPLVELDEVSTQVADLENIGHYNYTITRTWTAVDATGNDISVSQVITVTDGTAPLAVCKPITVNLDATGNVSIIPSQIENGSTDNCSPVILVSAVPSSFNCSNVGNNTIVLTVRDVTGNISTCTATVTVEGYAVIDTQPVSKEIVYGCDAPILSVAAHLVGSGTITYQWYKNTTNSISGGTQISGETSNSYQTPHNYNVDNYYYYAVVTVNSCSVVSDVAKVAIIPQTAAAVGDIYYTGPVMAWTTSATSNTATVTLSATIKNGLPCGDIRTARITFTVNGQPIPSAQNLPVGFIDPNNPAMGGTASAIVQLNIANNATSDIFDIGVIISGNYTSGNFVPGVVTIIKPKPGGVIGGAASLCNDKSTGYVKGTGKASLNFYVEYAMKGKSITNPKGKVSLCVSSYNKPDGTIDNILHWYFIKSNAIASLNITSPTATFSGKANIAEINPLTGALTAIEGNCQMVLDLTDAMPDQVGITIQRNGGGIWYSNNWVNINTVKTPICGGDISVSGTPVAKTTARTTNPIDSKQVIETPVVVKEEKETTIDAEPVPFNVIAYPNPAKYQFTLVVEGGSKEKIEVVLYDVLGRTVKHIESTDGQPIVFGEELPRGTYFTIVNQGANQKTVRLIKQ